MRNAYNILVGEPERKRPLGRPRHKWNDNIIMDLSAVGWEGVVWIHQAKNNDQWRVIVNTVINLRVTQKTENVLTN
jgi:hypothetical protein